MFAPLFERLGASARASPSDSIHSAVTVDISDAPSASSTPPTSVDSDIIKPSVSSRSARTRTSITTYNVKVLSGTAIHAPKKYVTDQNMYDEAQRRRSLNRETLAIASAKLTKQNARKARAAQRLASIDIDALDLSSPSKKLSKSNIPLDDGPRISPQKGTAVRSSGEEVEPLAITSSALGKRRRHTTDHEAQKLPRELRNLADTLEFAHIDEKPVIHTIWSKGKFVPAEPPKKKRRTEEAAAAKEQEAEVVPIKNSNQRKQKVWLGKGLYAGQEPQDWFSNYTAKEKEKMQDMTSFNPTSMIPLPMWHGQRLLHVGRHFKLPFDVCSPLPPGQPKPEEWHKTSSNRFIGDAAALWKKTKLFESFSSKCVCSARDGGCDERCQNRIMLYECDDQNCGAGRVHCTNRPFADLQDRRKGGGKYRIGVEVIKTADRGYGVRSNRCFDSNQIIVEYTGEIITEDECDRRMNEDYKDNECYYLMSFDQNMIIDATKGSIARFVNHSCKPNCRMVKWIVGGKPRMALFAGDGPIMTGDELTYDYNFDPFSAKNVQECRCGSANCRGVLGPKPKDQKIVKETIKETLKAGVKATKRKLKEMMADDDDEDDEPVSRSPKKRKMKEAVGIKRAASSAGMSVVRGAAAIFRKSLSTSLLGAKKGVKSTALDLVVRKASKSSLTKTYGRSQTKLTGSRSSLEYAAENATPSPKAKRSPRKSTGKGGREGLSTRASSGETSIRSRRLRDEE